MDQKLQYKRGSVGRKMKVLISDAVEILEGYPICFNSDYGTAANVDYERLYQGEKPSTSNNMFFAGVAAESKPVGTVGTQELSIWLPGSICLVYTNQNCTINSTIITAEAGQWRFGLAGFRGKGTAVALQTVDRSSTAGTVLAWLDEGEQSGLIEHVDITAGGAVTCMVGGTTRFAAQTVATANATFTLADGTYMGERKAFLCDGTLTTNDFALTVTTHALIAAVAVTGYDVVTMDASGEGWGGFWTPGGWFGSGKSAA